MLPHDRIKQNHGKNGFILSNQRMFQVLSKYVVMPRMCLSICNEIGQVQIGSVRNWMPAQ